MSLVRRALRASFSMSHAAPRNPLIVIIGATGTGKSQLAIEIAKRFNGEIINGDAMQLYAGLPIITNKIPEAERHGIPHHLLDCIGLKEQTWVVGKFVRSAQDVIDGIRDRGRLPILVGGTHYYTQSLLFRDKLAEKGDGGEQSEFVTDLTSKWPILGESTENILRELQRVDPVMADRWHPNDRRKIQRSLEIYLQTGRKASEIYAEQREARDGDTPGETDSASQLRYETLIFWVHAETEALRTRLDKRVDKMLGEGLLDEVQSLDSFARDEAASGAPIDESKGIWVSIGYKEFKNYCHALRNPETTSTMLEKLKAEAVERTKISTRQYSKSQVRWIRIKLVNALAEAKASNRLFLVDGTDAAAYDVCVVKPAADITDSFLHGGDLPSNALMSSMAAEFLTPKRDFDMSAKPDQWFKKHCEACDVTCVTADQWNDHIKSKAHKKLTRKLAVIKEAEHLAAAA